MVAVRRTRPQEDSFVPVVLQEDLAAVVEPSYQALVVLVAVGPSSQELQGDPVEAGHQNCQGLAGLVASSYLVQVAVVRPSSYLVQVAQAAVDLPSYGELQEPSCREPEVPFQGQVVGQTCQVSEQTPAEEEDLPLTFVPFGFPIDSSVQEEVVQIGVVGRVVLAAVEIHLAVVVAAY